MKTTTNYNLNKPESTDHYNVTSMNDNMDIIDSTFKSHETEYGYVVYNITDSFTAPTRNSIIFCDTTNNPNITITLPTAVGNKWKYIIKRIDKTGNQITVNTINGEQIDTREAYYFSCSHLSTTIVSNGSNWFSINESKMDLSGFFHF